MEPDGSLPHSQVSNTYPYPKPDQSSPCPPSHPTSWKSILILSSHLHLRLPGGLLPSGFPIKALYTPLLSPIRATWPAHLILLDFSTRKILGEECKSLSSSLFSFSQFPFYLVSLTHKYSPKRPILKQPHPTFLSQYKRPSFTPAQKNRQNYNFVHLNLYVCGQQTVRHKILHRLIASTPRLQLAPNFFLNRILICYSCS